MFNQVIMDPLIAILFGTLFLAALIQRLAGFGYGVIGAPISLIVFDAQEVAMYMTFWGLAFNIPVMFLVWKDVQWRPIWRVFPWQVLGLLAGLVCLIYLPTLLFKIIALIICAQAFASVFRPEAVQRLFAWTVGAPAAGTLAGLLHTTVSTPGLPMVVHYNTLRLTHAQFVGTLSLTFMVLSLVRVPATVVALPWPEENAAFFLFGGMGATFVGVVLGQLLVPHVSGDLFKRIAAFILALSALSLLYDVVIGV